MLILANVISFLGYLTDIVVGFKYNEKAKIVLFNLVSSSCSLIAMLLLHSLSGCVSVGVTLIRLIVIYLKDKYKWSKANILVPIFVVGYACVFFDKNILIASLMFTAQMSAFLPKWFCQNAQALRLGNIVSCALTIPSSYLVGNYSAIPFCILGIVTTIPAYIKWYKVEKVTQTVKVEV